MSKGAEERKGLWTIQGPGQSPWDALVDLSKLGYGKPGTGLTWHIKGWPPLPSEEQSTATIV